MEWEIQTLSQSIGVALCNIGDVWKLFLNLKIFQRLKISGDALWPWPLTSWENFSTRPLFLNPFPLILSFSFRWLWSQWTTNHAALFSTWTVSECSFLHVCVRACVCLLVCVCVFMRDVGGGCLVYWFSIVCRKHNMCTWQVFKKPFGCPPPPLVHWQSNNAFEC